MLYDLLNEIKRQTTNSLNPYSNGICSMIREGHQGKITLLIEVLILILMEYALRGKSI